MDHDDSLLLEQIVRQTRIDERGPIAEFLAKKNAEQARETSGGYRAALYRFRDFLGEDATSLQGLTTLPKAAELGKTNPFRDATGLR